MPSEALALAPILKSISLVLSLIKRKWPSLISNPWLCVLDKTTSTLPETYILAKSSILKKRDGTDGIGVLISHILTIAATNHTQRISIFWLKN